MATWLAATSTVVAPMRPANRRSASGGMAWSSPATMNQEPGASARGRRPNTTSGGDHLRVTLLVHCPGWGVPMAIGPWDPMAAAAASRGRLLASRRRTRAGNRRPQDRVRAGPAHQGRTRHAGGPGARVADLCGADRGHRRAGREASAASPLPGAPETDQQEGGHPGRVPDRPAIRPGRRVPHLLRRVHHLVPGRLYRGGRVGRAAAPATAGGPPVSRTTVTSAPRLSPNGSGRTLP